MRVWFNGRTSAFQAEDAGSIPATRSMFMARVRSYGFWQFGVIAHIAQSVEHFLGKEEVTGSNPVMSSIYSTGLDPADCFCLKYQVLMRSARHGEGKV